MSVDFKLKVSCAVHGDRFVKLGGSLDTAENGVELDLKLDADDETWQEIAHTDVSKATLAIKAVERGLSIGFQVKPLTPKFCVADSWKNWAKETEGPAKE